MREVGGSPGERALMKDGEGASAKGVTYAREILKIKTQMTLLLGFPMTGRELCVGLGREWKSSNKDKIGRGRGDNECKVRQSRSLLGRRQRRQHFERRL